MTHHLPPLQTREELNEKLDAIRKMCNGVYYIVVIVITVINIWNIFWAIPLWFVMAFTYTQLDNYHEAKYLNAVLERKRYLTNTKGHNNR